MSNRITFAQLDRVLADLKFRKTIVRGEGVVYDYAPTKTVLVVSTHRSNEMVPDYVLASIRHQLYAQDVISATEFEGCFRGLPRELNLV